MSLMRLAPEAVRLRRMAKAYAAGEMSQVEYRASRREVIDTFPTVPPLDDDTRPRWPDDQTVRNHAILAVPAAPVAAGSQEAAASVPPPAARRWWWVALLVGLLATAAVALPVLAAESAIPPVSARSPDPASSPRLDVRGVTVTWGGAPAQKLGDGLLATLQQRADQTLAEVQARNAPGPHGFTTSELTELARLLNVLGVHEAEGGLDAADARDISALIREQKQRRGVSVAQLEQVAAAVQAELRDAGYFLASAYLPSQQVDGALARIEVLPGMLGDIVVEGGDAGPVTGAFSPLLGRPLVLREVSSRLQALNALPGVTAQASFGPGQQVGEARLRLDLLEQRDWVASLSADNHGDETTGEQRIGVSAAWLNPRSAGDRLSVGGLFAVNPANQTFGYLDYDTPVGRDYRLSARIGNNDFTREGGIVDLDGGGFYLDVAARRSLTYSRERALTLVLAGARQTLDWDDGINQTVSLAGVGLAGHRVLDQPRIAADAAVSLSVGRITGDRFAGQDSGFWLLEVDSEAWMPVSLPLFDGEQKLKLSLAGQWADSLLPATRRFVLGGAGRARGYDRGAFVGDRGVRLALEARVPIGVGEIVLFSEYAYGDGRSEAGETWAQLADVGVGWDANFGESLRSSVSWAVPFSTSGSDDIDDGNSRLYWTLRYDL